jgi:hypothetical protein
VLDDKIQMYLESIEIEFNDEMIDEEDKVSNEVALNVYSKKGPALKLANKIVSKVKYSLEELVEYAENHQGTLLAEFIVLAEELVKNKFDLSEFQNVYINEYNQEEFPCPIFEYMQIVYKIDDDCKLWFWLDQDFQNNYNEYGISEPTLNVVYNGTNFKNLKKFDLLYTYTEFLNKISLLSESNL